MGVATISPPFLQVKRETIMSMNTCSTCVAFHAELSECRYNPPFAFVVNGDNRHVQGNSSLRRPKGGIGEMFTQNILTQVSIWPEVKPSDGCRQWESA